MDYTVEWNPLARTKLAQMWVDGPDRQAITDSADLIDLKLMRSPETVGKASGEDRLLIVEPLAVIFSVDPVKRKVFVLEVWRW